MHILAVRLNLTKVDEFIKKDNRVRGKRVFPCRFGFRQDTLSTYLRLPCMANSRLISLFVRFRPSIVGDLWYVTLEV